MDKTWLIGKKKIAKFCGLCEETITDLYKNHGLPVIFYGSKWISSPSQLEEWMSKQTETPMITPHRQRKVKK